MGTERFWKIVWAVAVWHNIIGGGGLIFFGNYLYARVGLEPPVPQVHYVRWWYLILVFALIYYHQVDPKRMTPLSYGESRPIADNRTTEGRALNRRVEFKVLVR